MILLHRSARPISKLQASCTSQRVIEGRMTFTRRTFLGAAAALPVAGMPAFAATLANLGRIAGEKGLKFGSAFDREVLSDVHYRTAIAQTCRIGAIENSMKFDWLKPRGRNADYSFADRLMDFAAVNQIAPKGTAMIWNDWTPPWLNALSTREIAAELDRHVEETAARYAGRMWAWDVVNEPFFPMHGRDGGFRKGPWLEAMGPDYIARAFRRAAAADPSAHLILNEAFCEQNDDWGNAIRPLLLAFVRRLLESGVKIGGIGFQAHLKPHLPHDYRRFAAYAAQFAAMGLDIHISELDVDDTSFPDDIAIRDRMVAAQITEFLTPVLNVPRLKSICVWHLSDRFSWYRTVDWYGQQVRKSGGDPKRAPRTHFLDANLNPKPAWRALETALVSAP
jgi:endo-1,4-beta-xylanase